ncbi:MAG: response regulator [Rickettsiales bacterium]|nr:response regulator [Rickettsiales bacterium]
MIDDKIHVLVIDDDDRLRSLLKKFLRDQGFMVTVVASAQDARQVMEWFMVDVLVLDVMMPGEDGLEFLRSLPKAGRPAVLMLSAMGEAEDRIKGLEFGADDYLAKPFEPKELVLRLKTIMRRIQISKPEDKLVCFGDYCFDLETNQLTLNNDHIYLTPNEAQMLRSLAEQSGQPVSREALSKLISGGSSERSVDVQITRLRKKIEPNEGRPIYLQTVRGSGYVLYANVARKAV